MGQENGVGGDGLAGIPLGTKNKYQRMDLEVREDEDHQQRQMGGRTNADVMKYVVACAVFASLNNVLLGYDVGVMSGAIIFIKEDLNISEVQQEVLVGILSIMSLVGSLGAGKTSDVVGRKWTIGIAAIIFQTGAAIMTMAPSFLVLMIGRLLAGIGIGFGVMIAPVYIAEISPTTSRGLFTSFPEVFINVGILLGYISNFAFAGFSSHINWRIMLAVGILPAVFIAFALFIIPESPRWLVMQNRIDEARAVLMKTTDNVEEADEKLAEIEEAAKKSNDEKFEEKSTWRELLSPTPAVRRMLITGIGIQCFQQATGIDATVYYSPTILKDAGIEDKHKLLAATVSVGLSKTVFILVATFLVDKVGRKPLLYVSTIGMTVCLFVLALSLAIFDDGTASITVAIIAVCSNVAFFSIGLGPVCWILTSEIFPLKLRSQASALGSVGNRVASGMVAMSFLSVTRVLTVAGTFFLFSAISILAVAFVHFYVPETKGKSLEQIELLFQKGDEWQTSEVELGDVEHLVQKE